MPSLLRATPRLLGLVAAGLASILALPPAAADRLESRVLVVPLDPGNADAATAEEATAAILRGTAAAGARPTRAQASLADTAAIVGCDPATRPCLDAIGAALNVDQILYGTLRTEKKRLSITLTLVARDSEPVTRVIAVESDAPDGMQHVEAEVSTLVQGSDAAGRSTRPVSAARPPASEPPPGVAAVGKSGFDLGRVHTTTWLIAGGGAALMTAGALFWLEAADDQDQIDRAPIATVDDLERLSDLEERAVSHSRWGNGLFIGGGVALAGGIVLAVYQGRAPERPAIAVSPLLLGDGVGVAVTLGGGR